MVPKHIVTIDPGLHRVAYAIWSHETAQLVRAGLVEEIHDIATERSQKWLNMGRAVELEVSALMDIDWVIEVPQVYKDTKGKDPNDLIDLAGVLGAIVASHTFSTIQWSPKPREWKGQLPKEITQTRVDAKLSPQEKLRVKWPIQSLVHNVYDAIHLGIVYLEREGLRDFMRNT